MNETRAVLRTRLEFPPAMYVCPDCRTPLGDLCCPTCDLTYALRDGIPILLPSDPRLEPAVKIAVAYDSIYREHTNVWLNQGRTPQFLDYFASLLGRFPATRILEVGCGEGFLLGRLAQGEKFATDLSTEALKRARMNASAHLSVALAERLPFPSSHFDLVASVAVMEHFLDIDEALGEIRRVLRPGGHYVGLTHVELTLGDRVQQKISEYFFPRLRPLQFARWLRRRLRPPVRPELVQQPIQNRYTIREAKARLQRQGLQVVEVLHARRHPRAPLGPEAVIYVARRRDGQ